MHRGKKFYTATAFKLEVVDHSMSKMHFTCLIMIHNPVFIITYSFSKEGSGDIQKQEVEIHGYHFIKFTYGYLH